MGGASSPSDPDYPFVNLSSEAPDVDVFIGRRYGPPPGWPLLGNLFFAIGCVGWCASEVSQEDANLCAAQQEVACLGDNWPDNPNPGTPPTVPPEQPPFKPPTYPPQTIYQNSPQSASFRCPDGQDFTYTTPAGRFSAFSQKAADIAALTYAQTRAADYRLCIGSLTPSLSCSDTLYTGSIESSSVLLPLTFEVIGDLPPGIFPMPNLFSQTTFTIQGTPTTPGDYSFALKVTDTQGQEANKTFNLTFFGITNEPQLPPATIDSPYSVTLITEGTVTGIVTFTLTGGLPAGLTFNTLTGVLSGTPTAGSEGEYDFTVTASADGISCSKHFFLITEEATTCPDWSLLLWGVPAIATQDGGTASMSPDSIQSEAFSFHTSCTAAPFSEGQAENSGTIPYNGVGCDCNIHLEVLATGGVTAGTLEVVSALFGLIISQPWDSLSNGSNDIPFSIPDTLGNNDTITINLAVQSNWDSPGPCDLQVTGLFENI